MAQPQCLIVGLGNPGPDYLLNRHNVGFMVVDAIAASGEIHGQQKKFKAEIAQSVIGEVRCILMKPHTFMNLSGEAVSEAARFYKIDASDIIVFHDDIDLVFGDVRVKQGGGNAGHNGLKSLDAHIGKDYWRVRIGVGHPGEKKQVSDYVLGNFSKADKLWLGEMLPRIVEALPFLLKGEGAEFVRLVKAG
ncbi:MAG: aminoacyl-tRNA hydrolase [Alphaproteobacteria bacterium]|nr:aminoacyl-tRNA hydrolase [Alphaproteobacteria bacterium]